MSQANILEQQKDYYRARAGEYDEWFLRQGRYDRGPEQKARWMSEVDQVRQALAAFNPTGDVLEFASGTGWWTEELVKYAEHVTAVDASAETQAVNRARVNSDKVRYVLADIFAWQPDRQYDIVFFSFWLSHVPPGQFDAFWTLVRAALKPGGRVFFIDSLRSETSSATNHSLQPQGDIEQVRRLNDGSTYTIIKVYYDPHDLAARLHEVGWEAEVTGTANYFLYGRIT